MTKNLIFRYLIYLIELYRGGVYEKTIFIIFFISILTFTSFIYADTNDKSYPSGQYIIGQNMPSGEYQLSLENNKKIGGFKRTKNWYDGEIIQIRSFNNGIYYATFFDGEYIILENTNAIPLIESNKIEHEAKLYSSSMYRIGVDILPGEYQVLPNNSDFTGIATIFNNSSYYNINFLQFIGNDGVKIIIDKGDILELKHCYITELQEESNFISPEYKEYNLKEIRYIYYYITQEILFNDPNNSLKNELWKQELLYNANRLVYLSNIVHNQLKAQQTKILFENAIDLRTFIKDSIESNYFSDKTNYLFTSIPAWIESIDNPNPKLDPIP